MTPEEQLTIDQKLREVAEILYNNTPDEELATFETIELSVRDHLLGKVAPRIGEFFFREAGGSATGTKRTIKTCIGKITISSKQAMRLKLGKGNRLSPQIEKCCLLLVGNESFANAERDLEFLTGVKVAHSTQHRLVNSYQLPEPKIIKRAKSLSVDGGTVRLRTSLGQQSEWKNAAHSRRPPLGG